jgi:hypothetical protein
VVARPCVAAGDIGRTFAEIVEHDPAVRAIWVREHRGVCEIWLLTTDIDPEQERGLFAASRILHQQYPDALIQVHLMNPRNYAVATTSELVEDVLPQGMSPIIFRSQ